jgi:hypothetical protein
MYYSDLLLFHLFPNCFQMYSNFFDLILSNIGQISINIRFDWADVMGNVIKIGPKNLNNNNKNKKLMTTNIYLFLLLSTIIIYISNPVQSFALATTETDVSTNNSIDIKKKLFDCAKENSLPPYNKAVYSFKGVLDENLYNNTKMDNYDKKNFYININNVDNITKGSVIFTQNNISKYLGFKVTNAYTQCVIQIFEPKSHLKSDSLQAKFPYLPGCSELGITLNGVTFSNLNQKNMLENKAFNLKITELGFLFSSAQPIEVSDVYKGNLDFANKFISLDIDKIEFSCGVRR